MYIYSKSHGKSAPFFTNAITLIYIYERDLQDLRVVEKSFLILEGGRGLISSIRTQNRGLRNTSYASIDVAFSAITTSLEDVLQGRKSYRRGGEKREIRGKGKDGGTNKVHRRGWRDSRW